MLSRAERRYARNRRDGNVDIDPAYEASLQYRIRNKVEQARQDLQLLRDADLIDEEEEP